MERLPSLESQERRRRAQVANGQRTNGEYNPVKWPPLRYQTGPFPSLPVLFVSGCLIGCTVRVLCRERSVVPTSAKLLRVGQRS